MRRPLQAILFDLDGTLLDTAPDMIAALNRLRLEEQLLPMPFEGARSCVSHGAARLLQIGFPEADPDRFAVLHRRFLDAYRERLSAQTRLFEGMDVVLADLAQRGLKLGIVTNKPASLTLPLLEELDLCERFACVVSGDSLPLRKPHPLPMLHAAKLAGVAADACVYLGDAERDVQAAHAAGMEALVATYGYLHTGEDWQAWGGDGFLERPLDLIAWLEGSRRA